MKIICIGRNYAEHAKEMKAELPGEPVFFMKPETALLKETDFYLLPDVVIDENKLNAIKIYRQELRDFINKLLNDEIKCNLIDDAFEEKYFPKLIRDAPRTSE